MYLLALVVWYPILSQQVIHQYVLTYDVCPSHIMYHFFFTFFFYWTLQSEKILHAKIKCRLLTHVCCKKKNSGI